MVEIRPFRPEDAAAFRALNEAWITKYFQLEDPDRVTLGDPVTHIVDRGGHILMVWREDEPVGCCALLPKADGEYELGKMAVAEHLRGQGIGRMLLDHTLSHARRIGAKRLYLGSSTKLPNAVHLYESVGFAHYTPETPSLYARANVHMTLAL